MGHCNIIWNNYHIPEQTIFANDKKPPTLTMFWSKAQNWCFICASPQCANWRDIIDIASMLGLLKQTFFSSTNDFCRRLTGPDGKQPTYITAIVVAKPEKKIRCYIGFLYGFLLFLCLPQGCQVSSWITVESIGLEAIYKKSIKDGNVSDFKVHYGRLAATIQINVTTYTPNWPSGLKLLSLRNNLNYFLSKKSELWNIIFKATCCFHY